MCFLVEFWVPGQLQGLPRRGYSHCTQFACETFDKAWKLLRWKECCCGQWERAQTYVRDYMAQWEWITYWLEATTDFTRITSPTVTQVGIRLYGTMISNYICEVSEIFSCTAASYSFISSVPLFFILISGYRPPVMILRTSFGFYTTVILSTFATKSYSLGMLNWFPVLFSFWIELCSFIMNSFTLLRLMNRVDS